MTTGQRIQQARKNAGLSQKQLGEKLGLSASMIGQWENDLRKPKYETICRIAAALDVDFADLVPPEVGGKMIVDHVLGRLKNLQPPIERVNRDMSQMNQEGQEKVADYAEDILPRYRAETAPQSPPAPQEGKDTTPPPDGSEGPPDGE